MNPIPTYILILFSLLSLSTPQQSCQIDYFPMPQNCSTGNSTSTPASILPCQIWYQGIQESNSLQHFYSLINFYHRTHFKCETFKVQNQFKILDKTKISYTLLVQVADRTLKSAFTVEEEKYSLSLSQSQGKLTSQTYVGFVRGLETFMQSFFCDGDGTCSLKYLPINIQDQPKYPYRGMMIDSGHNFIPVDIILGTIDALMYNKMNVLHWQITNEDAFTVALDNHPELGRYGAEDEESVYSIQDIKDIVQYGLVRGVRIIPEIHLPYDARFWRQTYAGQDVISKSKINGQLTLDLTIDRSYDILRDIYNELHPLFPDPYVHMGSYVQIDESGFKNKSEILDANNLAETSSLVSYYTKRVNDTFSNVLKNKTRIYWIKRYDHILDALNKNDIMHWHGRDPPIRNIAQKMIVSMDPTFDLNQGFPNALGTVENQFITWRQLYNRVLADGLRDTNNMLGSEGLLWSFTTNRYSHHYKLWMRGSSIGERMWNSGITKIFPEVMKRMVRLQLMMDKRGIPVGSVTTQICEADVKYCLEL